MSGSSCCKVSPVVRVTQNDRSIGDMLMIECASCMLPYRLIDLEGQQSCVHLICRTCLVEVSLAEQLDGSMCPVPACRCCKRCPSDENEYASLGIEVGDSESEIDLTAIGEILVAWPAMKKGSDSEATVEINDALVRFAIYMVGGRDGNLRLVIQQQSDDWRDGAMYWCMNGMFNPIDGELIEILDVDADGEKMISELGIPDGAHVIIDTAGDIATRLSLVQR